MKTQWIVIYKSDDDEIVSEVIEADAAEAAKIEARLEELMEADLVDLCIDSAIERLAGD